MSNNGNGKTGRELLKERLKGFVTRANTQNVREVLHGGSSAEIDEGEGVTIITPEKQTKNGSRGRETGSKKALDAVIVTSDTGTDSVSSNYSTEAGERGDKLFKFRILGPNNKDFPIKNPLNDIESERDALKNEVEDLTRQLEELKAKISGLENASTKISPTLTPRSTEEVIEKSQDYWELQLQLSQLKEKLRTKETALSELENTIASKDAEVLALKRRIDFLNSEMQRVVEERFQFEASTKNTEDERVRIDMSLAKKVIKLERQVAEVESLRKQLAELEELKQAMFNSQSKYLSEMSDENDKLTGQILRLKQELRNKEGNVAAQKRIIDNLKSELQTVNEKLESERTRVADFQNLTNHLQNQIDELKEKSEQVQKTNDDALVGLASTIKSSEERHSLEKGDLLKRNEELDAKLNFIRQRTKDLVARTKESRAEKKQKRENERLILEQSNKDRSLHKNAVERWNDERVRIKKEELDKKRKDVSNIKRVDKLFEYARETLKFESAAGIQLRKNICEYLYADKSFENEKLTEVGFLRN